MSALERLRALIRDASAVASIEYSLLLGMIGGSLGIASSLLAGAVAGRINMVVQALQANLLYYLR